MGLYAMHADDKEALLASSTGQMLPKSVHVRTQMRKKLAPLAKGGDKPDPFSSCS